MTDRLANWLAQPTSRAEYTAVGLLCLAAVFVLWGWSKSKDGRL